MHFLGCMHFIITVVYVLPFVDMAYLGGSVSWFKFPGPPNNVRIRFTYRMTWEKGTGPCGQNCSSSDLFKKGNVPQSLAGLHWECISCQPKLLNDINTVLTSVSSQLPGWEQGENYFFQNNPTEKQYSVRLDGIQWSTKALGTGRLITTIDLRPRNDTNLPNASPVAAVQPLVGIPFGCPTTIVLPIEDPDADDLQTRLADHVECGGACTTLPHYILKKTLGHLIIDATTEHGYKAGSSYRVTLMIEDFPTYTIKVGNDIVTPRHSLSKIPLQFTVQIIDDPDSCDGLDVQFVYPTRADGYRVSYPGFKFSGNFQNAVYLENSNSSKAEFMSSGPSGMSYELLSDDWRNRQNVSRIYEKWNPPAMQSGDSIMCVWGRLHNGITTDTRCVVGLINDFDDCVRKNIQCEHNGTCINLWHRTTCKCPHGYKPKDCKDVVTCADFPCKNNGTCIDTGKDFICSCAPGFTGVDCEIEIDECASSPCQNGGHCINDINGFICSCVNNNTGLICDKDPYSQKVPGELLWPLVVTCVVASVVTAGTGVCCWWCCLAAAKKRRRKKEKKQAKNSIQPLSGNGMHRNADDPNSEITNQMPPVAHC